MRSRIRSSVAAALLLGVPAAFTWMVFPAAAQSRPAAPEIDTLQVNADQGLASGSTLRITVRGTPQAQVRVQVPGVGAALALREGARGVYTGSYTVRPGDRIEATKLIRANLAVGSQSTAADFRFPPAFVALANRPTPPRPQQQAQAQPPQQQQAQAQPQPQPQSPAPRIERQPEPLVAQPAPVPPPVPTPAPPPPPVTANAGAGTTVVFGTFDDGSGNPLGVEPSSVRLVVAGRDVTADSQITPQSFSYRGALPPGSHTVEVSARDLAGNPAQTAWIVDVGAPAGAPAAAASAVPIPLATTAAPGSTLPLQVASRGSRGAAGSEVVIDGRTAPGASVRVQVDAIAPAAGNRTSVAQRITQYSVVADPSGGFSFNLGSYRGVMGTRFEVSLQVSQGSQSAEQRLVLAPRPG